MKIGLLIAIERELDAFLQSGEERTEETVAGRTIYKTRMEGHDIYAVKSGCGEIDAAAATMMLIVKYGCELVLDVDLKRNAHVTYGVYGGGRLTLKKGFPGAANSSNSGMWPFCVFVHIQKRQNLLQ